MLSLKELWTSKIPYGNGNPISHQWEIDFVKEHGPVLLAGVTTFIFYQMKWVKRFYKIGVWAATWNPEEIERGEEPKQLPPPQQKPESSI